MGFFFFFDFWYFVLRVRLVCAGQKNKGFFPPLGPAKNKIFFGLANLRIPKPNARGASKLDSQMNSPQAFALYDTTIMRQSAPKNRRLSSQL